MVEIPLEVQERLKERIAEAGLSATMIDFFAPSREGCNVFMGTALANYDGSYGTSYAENYPLEKYPSNILRASIRGHHCELTAGGSFRSYYHLNGPQGYGDLGPPLRELKEGPLPDDTDFVALESQAMKFIELLSQMGLRLKGDISPDGLPVNIGFVRTAA